MSFTPVQTLEIWRTLSDGQQVQVGILAQNRQGVYFQYDSQYLNSFSNLSPFSLQQSNALQLAPRSPHQGLHGVFADSLPDGWGLLLMDRIFRQHGILPTQITAMDRLAFVGDSGMGALSYKPVSSYRCQEQSGIDLQTLGLNAQAIFDGQTEDVLSALVAAGSSGGARPKAQVYFAEDDSDHCKTQPGPKDEAWLVKFTSKNLALGHEEGICEAAYLRIAHRAGLEVPKWQLLAAPEKSGASHWLALKRFDWINLPNGDHGRLHMHSACGLLDADFRSPSLDYEDLIKASSMLCKSPAAGQVQFRRALFNLFAANQDDHSKNWAFLQNDQGDWSLAPFFDTTFSPHPFGEQATSFAGYGKNPPLKAIQKLAQAANFANWSEAKTSIEEIVTAISSFGETAKELGVTQGTINLIEKTLNSTWKSNKHLID